MKMLSFNIDTVLNLQDALQSLRENMTLFNGYAICNMFTVIKFYVSIKILDNNAITDIFSKIL